MLRRVCAVLALVVFAACGGDGRQSPILVLSVDESLAKGKELLEAKKFFQAREYLTHAFEIEPNSVSGWGICSADSICRSCRPWTAKSW